MIDAFSKTNYELLSDESEYINCGTNNIRYICPKHKDKGEMTISLSHLLSGRGCYYCGREKTENAHKKEFDIQANKELCDSKGLIYINTIRKDGKITICFKCKNHEIFGEQYATIYNLKRPTKGCIYCTGKKLPNDYILNKIHDVNPNIEILSKFAFINDYVKCKCKKHNYIYKSRIGNLLQGHSCYYCGIEKQSQSSFLSIDQVNKNISKINPHVNVTKYNGANKQSECFCNIHKKEFKKCYGTLLNCESGCSICYRERMTNIFGMGEDEFKNRISKIHPELVIIGKYINNSTNIDVYCLKHDHYFSATPVSLLNRLICCSKTRKTYKEEIICSILEDKWGYNITRQKTFDDCKDIKQLAFDIYLNDYNTLLEYQGEQHYRPVTFSGESYEEATEKFNYTQRHDKIKENYCKKNHINLIKIPYWEYENIEYFLFDELVKLNIIKENN